MAKFSNPIQAQGGAMPSMDSLVTAQPAAALAEGLESFASFAQQQAKNSQPTTESFKTVGRQAAIQDIARYQQMAQNDPRRAKSWLTKRSMERQAGLTNSGGTAYVAALKENLGVVPKAGNLEEQQAAEQAAAEARRDAVATGRQLMFNAGYTEENMPPEDQLYAVGMQTKGRVQQASLATANKQILEADRTEEQVNSENTYASFYAATDAQLNGMVQLYSQAVKQGDGSSVELKAQYIRDLEQLKMQLGGQLQNVLGQNGGNITHLSSQDITRIENRIDNTIRFIRGDSLIELVEKDLDMQLLGSASTFMEEAPDSFVTSLGLNHTLGFRGIDIQSKFIQDDVYKTVGDRDRFRELEVQTIKEGAQGIPSVAVQKGLPEQSFGVLMSQAGKTMANVKAQTDDNTKQGAADFLFGSLWDATYGKASTQNYANKRTGVPMLLKEAARMRDKGALAQQLEAAAAREGTTVDAVRQDYLNKLWKNKLLPSLRINDPVAMQSLEISASGSGVSLSINPQSYREQVVQAPSTPSTQMERDVVTARVNEYNKKLKQAERELNQLMRAFTQLDGSEMSDVSAAAEQWLVGSLMPANTPSAREQIQQAQREIQAGNVDLNMPSVQAEQPTGENPAQQEVNF